MRDTDGAGDGVQRGGGQGGLPPEDAALIADIAKHQVLLILRMKKMEEGFSLLAKRFMEQAELFDSLTRVLQQITERFQTIETILINLDDRIKLLEQRKYN